MECTHQLRVHSKLGAQVYEIIGFVLLTRRLKSAANQENHRFRLKLARDFSRGAVEFPGRTASFRVHKAR